MQLAGAMIFVRDLERMVRFYADVLGLRVLEQTATWAELDAGSSRLGLHAIPGPAPGETPGPARPREHHPIRLDFGVPDVDRERARLAALGVSLLDRPWGAVDAIDPEGNVLGLRVASGG